MNVLLIRIGVRALCFCVHKLTNTHGMSQPTCPTVNTGKLVMPGSCSILSEGFLLVGSHLQCAITTSFA